MSHGSRVQQSVQELRSHLQDGGQYTLRRQEDYFTLQAPHASGGDVIAYSEIVHGEIKHVGRSHDDDEQNVTVTVSIDGDNITFTYWNLVDCNVGLRLL